MGCGEKYCSGRYLSPILCRFDQTQLNLHSPRVLDALAGLDTLIIANVNRWNRVQFLEFEIKAESTSNIPEHLFTLPKSYYSLLLISKSSSLIISKSSR